MYSLIILELVTKQYYLQSPRSISAESKQKEGGEL